MQKFTCNAPLKVNSSPDLPLLLHDVLQPRHHLVRGQRPEAKPGATGLQGRDDLGQVVADHTESGVFRELLNH